MKCAFFGKKTNFDVIKMRRTTIKIIGPQRAKLLKS